MRILPRDWPPVDPGYLNLDDAYCRDVFAKALGIDGPWTTGELWQYQAWLGELWEAQAELDRLEAEADRALAAVPATDDEYNAHLFEAAQSASLTSWGMEVAQ